MCAQPGTIQVAAVPRPRSWGKCAIIMWLKVFGGLILLALTALAGWNLSLQVAASELHAQDAYSTARVDAIKERLDEQSADLKELLRRTPPK